jgi:predicted acylesterase/phospholipase RssA
MTKPKFVAFSLHGSSTKAAGTAGAAVTACEAGIMPNVIIGVSGGAMLAVPIALGMYKEALEFSRNMVMADWFDIAPTNDKGKLSWAATGRLVKSLFNAIFGRKSNPIYSLGVQNTQRKLSTIITPEIFEKYKAGDFAPCFIVSVDWCKTKLIVRNAKDLSYEQYLDAVHCSSVLPIASTGGRVDGAALEFDGGLWTQNASWWLLEHGKYKDQITDLVSIYVTPDNNEVPERTEPQSIAAAGMGALDIMKQVSYLEEEKEERKNCERLGIYLYEPRLPLVLQDQYDMNPQRLEYLQRMGSIVMLEEIERRK